MEGANFIPLGNASAPNLSEKSEKKVGQTKEERKQIARDYRLKAKKEKKKLKSDAKKQRKLNAILNRRMTRNNEKYSKNKERNKERAIYLERWAIWNGAIHQAERLAAKYDPSGKMFNVGEVVVMPDGQVKSKESLRRSAELKAQREKEKKELEAAKAAAAEAKKAIKEGKLPPQHNDATVEGVNPERQAFIHNLQGAAGVAPKAPSKISNKQKKRQELFAPRPVPPKPVIPEGYSIPEGEEDFLALWDISDEGIKQRMIKQKQKKGLERKHLRRQQKEQKKINKQLKARKKQAANLGILFDREKALKEIMGQKDGSDSSSDSESDSDSDSNASLEFDSDGEEITKTKDVKKATESKKSKAEISKEPNISIKPAKRLAEGATDDEPDSKRSRKSIRELPQAEVVEAPVAATEEGKTSGTNAPVLNFKAEEATTKEASKEAKREKKRLEKEEKKRQEKLSKINEELAKNNLASAVEEKESSKKRKRSKDEKAETTEDGTKEKKHKKSKDKTHREEANAEELAVNGNTNVSNGAEQWNPEALTGDAARRDKFLRLLGAGKSSRDSSSNKHKPSTKATDILHVQEDLEKQYEAGMKLKGSKRKGLGA